MKPILGKSPVYAISHICLFAGYLGGLKRMTFLLDFMLECVLGKRGKKGRGKGNGMLDHMHLKCHHLMEFSTLMGICGGCY